MARVEHDREDLLREATALRERAALVVPGLPEPVTCGFRDSTAEQSKEPCNWSVYFGSDPVYHFDSEGRLRRAFADGFLYRSQGSTLARLNRVRTERETILSRHDLSAAECEVFLTRMQDSLRKMAHALSENTVTVQAQVPADHDLRPKLLVMLRAVVDGPPRLAPQLKR